MFVPPFAEEMNKCRRQYSVTAELLASKGLASVVFDLSCTGDSSGEFVNAQWHDWKHDLALICAWIDGRGLNPYAFVATRLGCVLAADSVPILGHKLDKVVFWQPIIRGNQFITQFLRMRLASSLMGPGPAESMESIKEQIANNGSIEVAGYHLSRSLYESVIEANLLHSLRAKNTETTVFEISPSEKSELSVAARKLLDNANSRGIKITGSHVRGEQFWTSTEIVCNPILAEMTSNTLA